MRGTVNAGFTGRCRAIEALSVGGRCLVNLGERLHHQDNRGCGSRAVQATLVSASKKEEVHAVSSAGS